MDYMSIAEASQKWGISTRRIQVLCVRGRIPGLERFGNAWAIPLDAKKPIDARIKSGRFVGMRNKGVDKLAEAKSSDASNN